MRRQSESRYAARGFGEARRQIRETGRELCGARHSDKCMSVRGELEPRPRPCSLRHDKNLDEACGSREPRFGRDGRCGCLCDAACASLPAESELLLGLAAFAFFFFLPVGVILDATSRDARPLVFRGPSGRPGPGKQAQPRGGGTGQPGARTTGRGRLDGLAGAAL